MYIHVHVCVHIHVYGTCTYMYVYVHVYKQKTCLYMCMFTYIGCACTSIHVRAMYLYTCRGIIILHSCGTCVQCMYGTCVYVDGTSTNVYMCMHMYDTCVSCTRLWYMYMCCLGSSVGRALCLEYRV